MTWDDHNTVALSTLEHYVYCHKQAYLIRESGQWVSDESTVSGDIAHVRIDSGSVTYEKGWKVVRSLPVYHDELGILGVADCVEFSSNGQEIRVVEHKVGLTKLSAAVQLCAQVLCVQQMYSEVNTVTGFLFSHKTRTRTEVLIDSKLIDRTLQTILDARKVLTQTRVPEGANDYRCDRCSLLPICLPETMFGEVCEFTE